MKKKFLLLCCFLLVGLSSAVNATVINFDDVSATTSYTSIPDGYAGFNWEMQVIHKNHHPGTGYDLGRVSGDYAAWYYDSASVSSATDFNFTGAYFSSAWDSTLSILLEGWNDGAKIYSDFISVVDTGPTWEGMNYLGIDELKIISQGNQFVMDDFTFDESEPSPTPEPTTMLLFGVGLIGLAGVNRRKK